MASFINLTNVYEPETPIRGTPRQQQDFFYPISALPASNPSHHPSLQQCQSGVTVTDEEVTLRSDLNGRFHLFAATSTKKRKSSATSEPRRSFVKPFPPPNKLPQPITRHSENEVQTLNNRSRGGTILQSKASKGGQKFQLGRLATNLPSPPTKRRFVGLHGSSIPAHTMNETAKLPFQAELENAGKEDNLIDLTISANFPIWKNAKASPKRGFLDLSEELDGSEKEGGAGPCISVPLRPTKSAVNLREANFKAKLAAPGVRRRLAALGLTTKVDPTGIIDLSADSDSDNEVEKELEVVQGPFHQPSVIGPEDYLCDEEISKRLANLDISPNRKASPILQPTPSRREIGEFSQGNSRYKAGKNAELKDGNFLHITSVLKDGEGDVFLSGYLLSRQSSCGRLMPRRRNELVWIIEMGRNDFQAGCDPKPTDVPIVEAVGLRSVTFTNQRYPEMSLQTYKDGRFKDIHDELSTGPLFCRWKSIKVVDHRKQKDEDSLVHLNYAEADAKTNARIQPYAVRDMWRGSGTILGGSHFATRKSSINLTSQHSDLVPEHIQQYTFGDAFCGAGGCSCGASQAGFHVNWGFDKDKDVISIYADNIGRREGAESYMETVDEFCGRSDTDRLMVDCLHISPPCQPFSAAHTVPSQIQDEINQAALFSVWHLLEKIKPRVATIEETEGLVNRHVDWFNALINIFVSLGYSVRWKVVKCQDYGVPQQRKRLFIIAAGPGETLPSFARPTHGEPGSGLQAFKKIRHYIRDIPSSATQHDTRDRFPHGPRVPFSDDHFAKTLTCSGGVGNYHPSGLRFYTIREAACLQTFPISHSFTESKTKARRQIGNAVPPLLTRSMYREIIKCLKEADRLETLTNEGQS